MDVYTRPAKVIGVNQLVDERIKQLHANRRDRTSQLHLSVSVSKLYGIDGVDYSFLQKCLAYFVFVLVGLEVLQFYDFYCDIRFCVTVDGQPTVIPCFMLTYETVNSKR